ncbi:MAG: hypothetical protein NWQ38_04430 [Cellulophaga sp.]|nr:hypothetical protein [Cellulophaga sp.]
MIIILKNSNFKKVSILFLIYCSFSCGSSLSEIAQTQGIEEEVAEETNNLPPFNPDTTTQQTDCEETVFPSLGPSALQSKVCDDVINPLNIGTLDCRTDAGGYRNTTINTNNETVLYGEYSVTGSTKRYDGTKTRVERFFNPIRRGVLTSGKFSAKFIIDDLSNEQTCIVQAHAGGIIVAGQKEGQTATSAVYLVYATKTNEVDVFDLTIHESTTPYTTTTGGARTRTFFRNITKGKEYTMEAISGYNTNQEAFTTITIFSTSTDSTTRTLNHTFTSERVTTRYGAYGASDSGDTTAKISFRDAEFCRTN